MATIIDSLLVVLGLNASGFQKGAGQAQNSLNQTRQQVGKTGSDIEEFSKKSGQFIGSLRNEAVGLFLAFQGASSVKDFVGNMITGDAAAGRLAANLGMNVTRMTAYGLAVKSVGGDAGEANSALTMLAKAREDLKLTGSSGHDREFALLGFGPRDLDDTAAAFDKLAAAAQRMPRAQFYNLAKGMGLSDGVINLLELGPQKMHALIDARMQDAATTEDQARAAEELQAKWADLAAKITQLLRPEIFKLVDGLIKLVDIMASAKITSSDFNLALGALAATALVLGAPFTAAGAAITLLMSNMDWLEKKYAHLIWTTHGWFGGRDIYNGMVASGVKNTDDIDRIIDARKAKEAEAQAQATAAATASTGGVPGTGQSGSIAGMRGGGGRPDPQTIAAQLRAAGVPEENVKGIVAGIGAEGGSLGMAANGAFGIGQWRGARQRALFAKYGHAPNLQQQVAFLLSELRGGDPGGASVLRAGSATQALEAYIRNFMRPGPGTLGDLQRGYRNLGLAYRGGGAGGRGGSSVTINGGITVNTRATDANGIARDLPPAIRRRGMTGQANTGMD